MKTIAIRLPDVEAAMFSELRASSSDMRKLLSMVSACIRDQYVKRAGSSRG